MQQLAARSQRSALLAELLGQKRHQHKPQSMVHVVADARLEYVEHSGRQAVFEAVGGKGAENDRQQRMQRAVGHIFAHHLKFSPLFRSGIIRKLLNEAFSQKNTGFSVAVRNHFIEGESLNLSAEQDLTRVPNPDEGGQPRRRSGLGVASFVIGLSVLTAIAASIAALTAAIGRIIAESGMAGNSQLLQIEIRDRIVQSAAGSSTMIVSSLVLVVSILASIAGLGIAGAASRRRPRGFAVAGIVLNALPLLAVFGVFVIGLLAGA